MKTITAGSAGGVKKLKRKIQLENELKERKIVGQFDPNKKFSHLTKCTGVALFQLVKLKFWQQFRAVHQLRTEHS